MREESIENLRDFSRRERQIMDVIYRLGNATVAEIRKNLPDPPTYSAVRAILRILEDKGYLRHMQEGPRYIYSPKVSREKAKCSALKHLLQTFFDGSAENVVATLLDVSEGKLSEDEFERLEQLINKVKKKGR